MAGTRTLALAAVLHAAAWAQDAPPPVLPSFAELEAAGARFGEIRIAAEDIFDLDDPKEDYALFRLANALHIQTRPGVIRRTLLFKSGDPVSVRVLEETERLLLGNRYLYEVRFRPLAVRDGVVDVEVLTRDTWSFEPGISYSRSGGADSSGVRIREYNLLGTGTMIGIGRSSNVDRTSTEFVFANRRAFGTWTAVEYLHSTNSDGRRDAASVVRPFYALDTRWAAGATAIDDDRIDSIYNAGEVVSQYRHVVKRGEAFGGWSDGLVDGWVRRYSLGVDYQQHSYMAEPGLVAPVELPSDEKLVGPFVRFALIEDRYDRELNRNLIGRPEFFALGLSSNIQLGRASTAFGSSRDAWLYAGSVSRGFEPLPEHTLMASATISGQYYDGQVHRQQLGAQTQYYLPQSKRRLFYASAAADLLTNPEPTDELLLGGDNGLRGYPLRYQSGTRRALFTAEQRFYTDIYLWQLFRIGGAAFFDVGRAWGGDNINTGNPGWLSDLGFGLRIVSSRAAFRNVVHVDLAFPLNTTPDIEKVQFLITTKATF
jgi:hypothetical protein